VFLVNFLSIGAYLKKSLTQTSYSYKILPMPQRRAGKKDLRKNKKRHRRNLAVKRAVKAAIKKFKKALLDKDPKARTESFKQICQLFDKAVSKKVFHKNKAANKKSRLAKLLKTA